MAIRRVVLANGREDTDGRAGASRSGKRAISEGTAAIVTRILEQNVQYGTGTRAAFGRPAAGKTGTNEEHADAWFAGYTPDLATTVWIGYTKGEIPMENVHGIAVSGGSFPAEIWRLFMEPALEKTEPTPFPEPARLAGVEAVHARASTRWRTTRTPRSRRARRPRPPRRQPEAVRRRPPPGSP